MANNDYGVSHVLQSETEVITKKIMIKHDRYFKYNVYYKVRCNIQLFVSSSGLTHFMPLVPFDTPWKHQKTSGFLMCSGGFERDQWGEMG